MTGGPRSIGWLECGELRSNLSLEGDVSDVKVVDDAMTFYVELGARATSTLAL